jgi:hypothetical protein
MTILTTPIVVLQTTKTTCLIFLSVKHMKITLSMKIVRLASLLLRMIHLNCQGRIVSLYWDLVGWDLGWELLEIKVKVNRM